MAVKNRHYNDKRQFYSNLLSLAGSYMSNFGNRCEDEWSRLDTIILFHVAIITVYISHGVFEYHIAKMMASLLSLCNVNSQMLNTNKLTKDA